MPPWQYFSIFLKFESGCNVTVTFAKVVSHCTPHVNSTIHSKPTLGGEQVKASYQPVFFFFLEGEPRR